MSTDINTYAGGRIAKGCLPEHPTPTEASLAASNNNGLVVDVHKVASQEERWDAIRNNDIEVLARRIISLEEKLGERGWDPAAATYTQIPKTASIPAYPTSLPAVTVAATEGGTGVVRNDTIDPVKYTTVGKTHSDTIYRLDRVIQQMSGRVGGPAYDPENINTIQDAFSTTGRISANSWFEDNSTVAEAVARMDLETKKRLDPPVTGLYVVAGAGAGTKTGENAANALGADVVFGANGLANKSSNKWILTGSGTSYASYQVISTKGYQCTIEISSDTTFDKIASQNSSNILFSRASADTTVYTITVNNTVDCNDTSSIRVDTGNLTATGLIFVRNSSFLYTSNNLTSSTSNIVGYRNANIFVRLGRITCLLLDIVYLSNVLVNHDEASAGGIYSSSGINCHHNSYIRIPGTSSVISTGPINAHQGSEIDITGSLTCTGIVLINGARMFALGGITSNGAISLNNLTLLHSNSFLFIAGNLDISERSEVISSGRLNVGGNVTISLSTLLASNSVWLIGSTILALKNNSTMIVTGIVSDHAPVTNVQNSITTTHVWDNSILSIQPGGSDSGVSLYSTSINVSNGSVLLCNSAGVTCTVLEVNYGSQYRGPINEEAKSISGVPTEPKIDVDINSYLISQLITYMPGVTTPSILIQRMSYVDITDWSDNSTNPTNITLLNSSIFARNIGLTDGNNKPIGGMRFNLDITRMSQVVLGGWWQLSGHVSHNSTILLENNIIALTDTPNPTVDIKQLASVVNGSGGYINGVAQSGVANASAFSFDTSSVGRIG